MKRVLSLLLAALLLLPLCGCGAASAPAAETGRPSAAADDPEALCELGLRYLNGDGAEQSKERAVETLTQAAELGSAEAMLTLGLLQGEEGQYKKAAQWFRQAADLENPRAMYELAMLRWNGHYPNMDLKEAASLFRAAAESGVREAMYELGWCYLDGWGVEQDDTEAARWMKEAAAAGDPLAMQDCGWLYENGRGIEQSWTEACAWYERAAEAGNVDTMRFLGNIYRYGMNGEQDPERAISWYERAADAGDAESMVALGLMAARGEGGEIDYSRAKSWWEQAAALDNADGLTLLAQTYDFGLGSEHDPAKAKELYDKAAALGNMNAAYNLAAILLNSDSPEDRERGLEAMKDAALRGDVASMTTLAGIYHEGRHGVEASQEEDLRWLEMAAQAGDLESILMLGWRYLNGQDAPKNPARAAELYRQGAELGYSSCAGRLASCYMNGSGVEQDFAQAIDWLEYAAELGDWQAAEMLGELYRSPRFRKYVDPDPEKAAAWYEKAAALGGGEAMAAVGSDYSSSDPEEAVRWFRRAIDAGYVDGYYRMGQMYDYWGTKEYEKARECYQQGAELGSRECMWKLADLYEAGKTSGVKLPLEADPDLAIEWYEKAFELGDVNSAYKIGMIYYDREDWESAFLWFTRCAEADRSRALTLVYLGDAMEMLSKMYRKGLGTEADSEKSQYWKVEAAQYKLF